VFNATLAKVFGTSNERAVKRMLPTLAAINSHEEAFKTLTDEQLTAKTAEFKARIAAAGICGRPRGR
jgi:preprotein translocase subunit SecA